MVNILRLTVAYLNATMNVKPETQNRRLELTGLAKPGETRGMTGTGPGLARQESAGQVFGWFWNRTNPFLRSKPGLLAGYPDPVLTLGLSEQWAFLKDGQHSPETCWMVYLEKDIMWWEPTGTSQSTILPNIDEWWAITKRNSTTCWLPSPSAIIV